MAQSSEDTGVILALMQRFNEQRLPQTLALKKRVEQGECLSEFDIAFLEKVFSDANHVMPLIDKHPELQPIATRGKPVQGNYRKGIRERKAIINSHITMLVG